MSRGVVLPDPNLDFDPVEELDYGEDEPDIPGVVDPTQPSSSSQNRINSVDNLPAMINGDRDNNSGPALPPDFLTGSVDDGTPEDPGENSQNYNIGPALPPSFLLGPSLPDDETSGPPPEPSSSRSIGPALPPHLLLVVNQNDEEEDDEVDLYGPAPPPVNGNGSVDAPVEDYEDDDDDDVIGPALPPSGDRDEEQAAEEYALRRLAYEQEKEAQKNTTQREEWMLSLPQKLTNYGLGARTFSKGSGVEKDSSWTDAPGQKKRKIEDEPSTSSSLAAQKARDQEQERMARELNNSRQESLLDAHQKTKGPSGSNGTAPGVRRAFDREKDMEVRGFKNATSDEIKEKVGNLGSRFGSSKQQKYL